jgi:hypothetical protein
LANRVYLILAKAQVGQTGLLSSSSQPKLAKRADIIIFIVSSLYTEVYAQVQRGRQKYEI